MPENQLERRAREITTAGKKIHNEITYRGVDWLINTAVAVGFAYWSQRTAAGEKYFSKPVTNFFKKTFRPLFKSEASLEEGAAWGSRFVSIMAGGTAIIPPMMVLEDKRVKKKIVRCIDEKIYGSDTVKNDPKFAECYRAIDEEPPKDFKTGMAARILTLIPLIGITVLPATNRPLVMHVYDRIGRGSKWIAGKLGIKPTGSLALGKEVVAEGAVNGAKKFESNWDFLHTTIGFDLGLTFLYSFMHEATYKSLAAVGLKKANGKQAPQNVAADPPATAVPPMHEMPAKKDCDCKIQKAEKKEGFRTRVDQREKGIPKSHALFTQKIDAEPPGHALGV